MKFSNGNFLIFLGVIHTILGVSPFAFGSQFLGFASNLFFKISDGLKEFPLLNGVMNFESFAAFWFVYFGLIMIPLGILVSYIEKTTGSLPQNFIWAYLIIVLIGVYMIPFSGMTFLMLPHAFYMLYTNNRTSKASF